MSEDFQAIVRQKARELYDVCDVEGKGYITKSEMERLVQHLPLDMDQLEDVFDSLDDDKNGHLTLEEFTEGFGQFIARGMGGAPAEEDGMEKSVYGEEGDMETEEQQFNCTMRDLGAAGIFEESVSVDNIRELWARVRKTNPELLPSLETLLTKVSSEIRKTQSDYKNLETAMRSKNNQHDEEIRRLYDEMENQIKTEKDKLLAEERQKERQWREETERELQDKDRLYQETLKKQEDMTKRLAELNAMHAATAEENAQLAQEKAELEEQLEETQSNLEESQIYIEEVRKKFKDDRRARAKNALAMSEGIALEREALVRQLDVLREDNKALKDARDERLRDGDSLAAETGRGEVLHFVDGKEGNQQPNQERRGSMLGAYFGMGGMTGQEFEDDDCEFDDDPMEVPVVPMMNTAVFAEAAAAQAAAAPPRPEMASTAIETDPMPELEPPPPPEPLPKPEVASAVVQTDREPTPPPVITERDAPDGATEEEPPYEPIFNGMKAPERMFKVVFVGDSGVGKSSIIYRFCHDSFKSTFSATIGVDFQIKTVQLETHLVAMQIWDTAGQERFRSITKQYYRKADGVIIVYDITSHASFLNVRQWLSEVDDGTDEGAIIMLLGNKVDVPREADDPNMNIVTSKTGAQLAEQHDALFFEVSAKEGDNVKEAFHKMAGFLKEKEDDELRAAIQVSANIEKKGGCCLKK